MARIIKITVLILLLISVVSMPAYCDDAGKKLGRGLCNLFTFPLEFPEQVQRVNNTDGPMAAFTWGVVKGLTMTCTRFVVGLYETMTFPVPLPKDYKPILTDPEFFLEDKSW